MLQKRNISILAFLTVPMALLAAALAWAGLRAGALYESVSTHSEEAYDALVLANGPVLSTIVTFMAFFAAGVLAVGALLTFVRKPWALKCVQFSFFPIYALFLVFSYVVISLTGALQNAEVTFESFEIDSVRVADWRGDFLWPAIGMLIVVAFVHVWAWRRRVIDAFTPMVESAPAAGDRILENIRTYGRDPLFRKSSLGSGFIHFFVIIVVPFLMGLESCASDAYEIPGGSGKPAVTVVQMVKPKKKKKKKYVLNTNSPVIFHVPDIEDSDAFKQLDTESQMTYVANNAPGNLGTGGGDQGGWEGGMKGAVVRFIRLQYNGPDWNDGMTAADGNADVNFLQAFHKASNGKIKVARESESKTISQLKNFGQKIPPFVYMTGSGGIRISSDDAKSLREYLMNGGMLFADAGSPIWDRYFRQFMRQVFPDHQLRVIADDDPIFQTPYTFLNGAPPLWHHGGNKAMGIMVKGRWLVFYHPGDINDAWKTGHSGISPDKADAATKLGVNIVYYAVTQMMEIRRQKGIK